MRTGDQSDRYDQRRFGRLYKDRHSFALIFAYLSSDNCDKKHINYNLMCEYNSILIFNVKEELNFHLFNVQF